MSTNTGVVAKPKARGRTKSASTSAAIALTEAWRKRVKHIRLNRPGQKHLTLHQLIAAGRG